MIQGARAEQSGDGRGVDARRQARAAAGGGEDEARAAGERDEERVLVGDPAQPRLQRRAGQELLGRDARAHTRKVARCGIAEAGWTDGAA